MSLSLLEFTTAPSKSPFLYHGSPHKLQILKPHLATGLGKTATDKLNAIYASDQRNYAIMFALTIKPNDKGERAWSIFWKPDEIEVVIKEGKLDLAEEGYLYRLPSDTFRQVDEFQWVSDVSVKPLDYEIIRPIDQINWIKLSYI